MTATINQRLVCPSCSGDAHLKRRGTSTQSNLISCESCGSSAEMMHIPNRLYPENERGIVIYDKRTLNRQIHAWDMAAVARVKKPNRQRS